MLGVIAWTRAQKPLAEARHKLGMKPSDPGPLKDENLRTKYLPLVQDGLNNLEEALSIDPEYDDAMAYTQLLWRVKGDLEHSEERFKYDMDRADDWFQKGLDTRKAKAARRP